MLKVGDELPNLTLEGTMGGEKLAVDLAARTGKFKVLVFYPFAFTPV
jgi:peroxiredoxin